jgi:hypothetical protein
VDALQLSPPFTGRWMAVNSPADRVPSHGTDLFGSTYAIDFVAVDDRSRSAPWRWSALLAPEPPDRFLGFGAPILAPIAGTVALAHDGEADHEARRSPFTAVPYLVTQRERVARGAPGVAGKHVVIAATPGGPFVLLAHLQRGSVRVRAGDSVGVGETIGACGNSGNSTQPHVHVQATDSLDWAAARGVPISFPSLGEGEDGLPRGRSPFVVPTR